MRFANNQKDTKLFGAGLLSPTKCVTFLSFDSRMEETKQKSRHEKGAVMSKVGVVRSLATIASLLAFLIVLPAARADEANQATKVRFDQPVQIP
ncbi:MAG: hypothetical protein WB869_19115 [Candidatus Acidiferrales bacterium]